MTETIHLTATHNADQLITIELSEGNSYRVIVDDNVHAKLVLRYVGEQFANNVDMTLAENASIKLFHLQNAAREATINTSFSIKQASSSNCAIYDSALGGGEANIAYHIELNGEGANCDMTGLFITDQQQKINNSITMVHNAAHTTSNQNYKGIAQNKSVGGFFTKVVVAKDAQKIASTQSNKNLLLSDQATIISKPELEIYANDVQCAHGATVGELDHNALFYLQSRGIEFSRAQAMLTYAFVQENLDHEFGDLVKQAVLTKIPNHQLLEEQA